MAGELDLSTGDPDDWAILATAISEGMSLITADRRMLEWTGPATIESADI